MSEYTENQLRSAAVTIIDEFGQINTAELKAELRNRLQPSGRDLDILENRSDDRFSQKVRNLVSHLSSPSSLASYVDIDRTVKPTIFISRRFKSSPAAALSPAKKEKVLEEKAARSRSFTGRIIDHEKNQRERKELGELGELFYLDVEKQTVRKLFGEAKARQVLHTAKEEGDGTGYDILSFDAHGLIRHIEVKTTKGGLTTPFYMTDNERAFYELHIDSYVLVRVYDFDVKTKTGKYETYTGHQIAATFDFNTQSYRVTFR